MSLFRFSKKEDNPSQWRFLDQLGNYRIIGNYCRGKSWEMNSLRESLLRAGAVSRKKETKDGLEYETLELNGERYLFVSKEKEPDAKSESEESTD